MKSLSPMPKPPLEHYLKLIYPMEIVEDDGAWVASVPDLPGCNSYGATVAEAVENVQKVKALWIESQYNSDGDIPEPIDEDEFSGRFVLRIPKVLHRTLAYEARKQGVSLNHYTSHLLSQRQPVNAFMSMAQSILDSCSGSWKAPWMLSHAEHDRSVMMGRLSANTEFLMYMRKPPASASYKTSIPASARKQYLLTK